MTLKRRRLDTRHSFYSRLVGEEKVHQRTWRRVKSNVAKQTQCSWKGVARSRAHQAICPQRLSPGAADRILRHGEGCTSLMY